MELNFHHRIYLRDRTHTYLWIKDTEYSGYFLTMESGTIELVKVAKEDDIYRVNADERVWTLEEHHPDDFERALRIYHESTLEKSNKAKRVLEEFLGIADPSRREPVEERPELKLEAPVSGLDLATICKDLGITPAAARKALRGKVQKPGSSWVWPSQEALEPALAILRSVR